MVATVVTLLILYIPLALICRRFDKRDVAKVGGQTAMCNINYAK